MDFSENPPPTQRSQGEPLDIPMYEGGEVDRDAADIAKINELAQASDIAHEQALATTKALLDAIEGASCRGLKLQKITSALCRLRNETLALALKDAQALRKTLSRRRKKEKRGPCVRPRRNRPRPARTARPVTSGHAFVTKARRSRSARSSTLVGGGSRARSKQRDSDS